MKHSIDVRFPEMPLGNADIAFAARIDGEKIGTLKVSKGAIVWVPKNLTYGFRLAWSEFDEVMQEHGDRERR